MVAMLTLKMTLIFHNMFPVVDLEGGPGSSPCPFAKNLHSITGTVSVYIDENSRSPPPPPTPPEILDPPLQTLIYFFVNQERTFSLIVKIDKD